MGTLANKVIAEAAKWNGYLEKKANYARRWDESYLLPFKDNAGIDNYTIFAKWYRDYFGVELQGEPWCAMFVSTVFRRALGKEIQSALLPNFAGCTTGTNKFKAMGIWHTTNPQPGDVIMYNKAPGVNEQVHTGIVTKVYAGHVYTLEGNTSADAGVVANGGSVNDKRYALTYNRIAGYARPNYAKYEQGDDITSTEATAINKRIDAMTKDIGELSKAVSDLTKAVNGLKPVVWQTLAEIPGGYRDYAKTAVDKGFLRGTGRGLDVTEPMLRNLIFSMRIQGMVK